MRWLAIVGLHAVLASGLTAADITGTWIGTLPERGRTPARDIAFQFVQRGAELSGKAYNDAGASDPIISGTVSEGRVKFEVEALQQSGNQINIVLYRFNGTIDGEWIDLTRELAAARDASSGNDIPVRRAWDSDEADRNRRFHKFRLQALFR